MKITVDKIKVRKWISPIDYDSSTPIPEVEIPKTIPESFYAVLDRKEIVLVVAMSPSERWFTYWKKHQGHFDVHADRLKFLSVINIKASGTGKKQNGEFTASVEFDYLFLDTLVVGSKNEWLAYPENGKWIIVSTLENAKNGN